MKSSKLRDTRYVREWVNMDNATRKQMFRRSQADITNVSDDVKKIIDAVKTRGDEELRILNHRFNQSPRNASLRVPAFEFSRAKSILPQNVKEAIEYAVENVRRYHSQQEPDGIVWKEVRPGIVIGERTSPIDSAGFYVPRARGSFPSMLYMMAVPAQIAGVKRMVMASPPDNEGRIDAACLYVARLCGIEEAYAVGGAQAWAALAYGTETVQPVHKCIGPGSKYVAAAKKLLSDVIDCGLPAGPSESIILADSTAEADDLARNILVEAEHGSDSAALLITDSISLALEVDAMLPSLISLLPEPRKTFVAEVLSGYGGIIVVESIEEGADISNQFATEHLQIRTKDPMDTLNLIRHAGEILLGDNVPFSAANYAVGANAVLPTGGHARTWSGVSVRDFKKHSSIIKLREDGLKNLRHHAQTLAEYEDFPAHLAALKFWNPASKATSEIKLSDTKTK